MIQGQLARRAQQLADARAAFVEATVVRAQRPTSVRPGAAAIVHPDGTIEGFVGGVCAESSVRLHALRVLETGEPLLLRLLPGNEDGEELDAREGAVTAHNPCLSGGALEIFLEPCLPAPRLVVVGRSPIGEALGDLGRRVGFDVARADRGPVDQARDDAAIVVASHGRDEEEVLASALRRGVPYVALVASSVRAAAVRESLDVPDELRGRLRSPAGLDIGARTPTEIALAILAQIVAERHAVPAVSTPAVAIDPVCGMEVAVSEESVQLDVDGERLYFCAERCREVFAAEHVRGG
jgi:xanthine dehydrogenase accessory factor